jgi:hypothetical protein
VFFSCEHQDGEYESQTDESFDENALSNSCSVVEGGADEKDGVM